MFFRPKRRQARPSQKDRIILKSPQEIAQLRAAAAQVNQRLSNIGAAIQAHAEAHGYSVVEEWGGHGIGRNLHEAPSVPHRGPAHRGLRLRPGMVFTVEPMINAGGPECELQAPVDYA